MRLGLTFVHLIRIGVAAVKLEHVHLPCSERPRILLEEAFTSRISPAGFCAAVLIDTQFETFGVHLRNPNILYLRAATEIE